jgi:hypothetical protein
MNKVKEWDNSEDLGIDGRIILKWILIIPVWMCEPVTVAVRSEAWVLAGWLLGSWVLIPLKAWMFIRVFLCCVVLCR